MPCGSHLGTKAVFKEVLQRYCTADLCAPMKNRKSNRTKQCTSAEGLQSPEPVINKVHLPCIALVDAVIDDELKMVSVKQGFH